MSPEHTKNGINGTLPPLRTSYHSSCTKDPFILWIRWFVILTDKLKVWVKDKVSIQL